MVGILPNGRHGERMNFVIDTKVAPAGAICHLYVLDLTQEVWKTYISVQPAGHLLTTGRWGADEGEARRLLRKEIEREISKWSNHRDPRPSQLRRRDLLSEALPTI
jgi:hypothetical protein